MHLQDALSILKHFGAVSRENKQKKKITMTDKDLLKRKLQMRNGYSLVVHKTTTKAREIIPPSKKRTPIELQPQLESIKITLQRKRDIITTLDNEKSDLLDEESVEKEIVDRSQFEEDLEEMICRILYFCNASVNSFQWLRSASIASDDLLLKLVNDSRYVIQCAKDCKINADFLLPLMLPFPDFRMALIYTFWNHLFLSR